MPITLQRRSDGSSPHAAAIAGGVVGGVLLVALAAGLAWYCLRTRAGTRRRGRGEYVYKSAAKIDLTEHMDGEHSPPRLTFTVACRRGRRGSDRGC